MLEKKMKAAAKKAKPVLVKSPPTPPENEVDKASTAEPPRPLTAEEAHNLLHFAEIKNKTTEVQLITGRKIALFESFRGRIVGCNPFAIYRQMKSDLRFDDYQFFWVTSGNVVVPTEVETDPRSSTVELDSSEYGALLFEAEIIVFNVTLPKWFIPRPLQKVVATWHGLPIKTLGLAAINSPSEIANVQKAFNCSNLILTAGPFASENIVGKIGARIALDCIQEVGSPRVDETLLTSKEVARRFFSIYDDKPVILYAPTRRGTMKNVSADLDFVQDALNALVKNSSNTHHIFYASHDFSIATENGIEMPHGVRQISMEVPINTLLAGVDLLISDYSSIVWDFLPLGRPIILYVPDLGADESEYGFVVDLFSLPVNLVTDAVMLETAVAMTKPAAQFPNYQDCLATYLPLENGKASIRAVNAINDLDVSKQQKKKSTEICGLIYAGTLKGNGITAAFLNLAPQLRERGIRAIVLGNGADYEKEVLSTNNFWKMSRNLECVVRGGKMAMPAELAKEFEEFKKGTSKDPDRHFKLFAPYFALEARRLLGNHQFDFSTNYSGYSAFYSALILMSQANKKSIFQHSILEFELNNLSKDHASLRNVFAMYKSFDKVIGVSQQTMETNQRMLSGFYAPNTAAFVNNVIDVEFVKKRSEVALELVMQKGLAAAQLRDHFKFIALGRLSSEKNHRRLLKAFSEVLQTNPKSLLFIVGEGDEEAELIKLSQYLDVSENVIFTGYLNNPFPLLSCCDCMVLASDYEAQPMVILEAGVLGVYCISTNFPGAELLVDPEMGMVVGHSAQQLGGAMRMVLSKKNTKDGGQKLQDRNGAILGKYIEVLS